MSSTGSSPCTRDALISYRGAVTALQSEIERAARPDMVGLSWSTLFLGLFEVRISLRLRALPRDWDIR